MRSHRIPAGPPAMQGEVSDAARRQCAARPRQIVRRIAARGSAAPTVLLPAAIQPLRASDVQPRARHRFRSRR